MELSDAFSNIPPQLVRPSAAGSPVETFQLVWEAAGLPTWVAGNTVTGLLNGAGPTLSVAITDGAKALVPYHTNPALRGVYQLGSSTVWTGTRLGNTFADGEAVNSTIETAWRKYVVRKNGTEPTFDIQGVQSSFTAGLTADNTTPAAFACEGGTSAAIRTIADALVTIDELYAITTPVTLASLVSGVSLDGHTFVTGGDVDVAFLTAQANPAENGFYTVNNSGAPNAITANNFVAVGQVLQIPNGANAGKRILRSETTAYRVFGEFSNTPPATANV